MAKKQALNNKSEWKVTCSWLYPKTQWLS